jgi:Tol biopolymer transport system component
MIMNADGSNQRVVVSESLVDHVKPDWSPDGTQLMFNREPRKGGASGIYIVNVNGTGLRKVVDFNHPGSVLFQGAWSPLPLGDGQYKIAFSDRAKLADGTLKAYNDLFLVNLDGTGLVQRTDTAGVDLWDVDWSPTGDRLAVQTWNPTTRVSNLVVDTILCDMTGGCTATSPASMIRVPNSPLQNAQEMLAFDWSKLPDSLVVSAQVPGEATYDLWAISADYPISQSRLTYTPTLSEDYPSWSPDDLQILFMRSGGIWVMNADGTGAKQIATPQSGVKLFQDPNWRRNP